MRPSRLGAGAWRRVAGLAMIAGGWMFVGAGAARGEPVTQREALSAFWSAAGARRVDVVSISDSNALFHNDGWDAGWTVALAERFGLYASPLLSVGENDGVGAGQGESCNAISSSGTGLTYGPFPEPPGDSLSGMPTPARSAGLSDGGSITGLVFPGAVIRSDLFDLTAPGRIWLVDGGFARPGGRFRPFVRTVASFRMLLVGPDIVTQEPEAGVRVRAIPVPPANAWDTGIEFRLGDPNDPSGPPTGPLLWFYQRYETGKDRGASFHTLAALGGQSLSEMAQQLAAATDASLTLHFSQVRALQTSPRFVLFRVNSGLNDRNRAATPSAGPGHLLPGDGAPAYADNLTAIASRVEQVWAMNGWDLSEVYWLVTPSHATAGMGATDDDVKITSYRRAAETWAAGRPRTAVVDLAAVVPSSEMARSSLYDDPAAPSHLTRCGYLWLARQELRALMGRPLSAPGYTPTAAMATPLSLGCDGVLESTTEWAEIEGGIFSGAGSGSGRYGGSVADNFGNERVIAIDHAGGYLLLSLNNTPGDGDLNLYLLDASADPANVVAMSEDTAAGGGGEGIEIESLPAGRYYAVIDTGVAAAHCGRGVDFRLSRACGRCVGDFDGSGGAPDGTDIEGYFAAWLAGDPRADADASGGTPDFNDIQVFFDAWLAGC